MLIGSIVTLDELEKLLMEASNKYKLRLPKLRYEAGIVEKKFLEMNRYRSDENDNRYVTKEARDKYYEIQKIQKEYDFVSETLTLFTEAMKDLETYEARHRNKGLFVKKSENTFELTPKYLQLLSMYNDGIQQFKNERADNIKKKKEVVLQERVALEAKKEAAFISALEKSIGTEDQDSPLLDFSQRAEETVQNLNEENKLDESDDMKKKEVSSEETVETEEEKTPVKKPIKEEEKDKAKAPKFRVPDKK